MEITDVEIGRKFFSKKIKQQDQSQCQRLIYFHKMKNLVIKTSTINRKNGNQEIVETHNKRLICVLY